MDQESFVDAVRDEAETALSRLGSSKSLYAATGGEMDEPAVLRSVLAAAVAAAETYEGWSEDETDERTAEAFRNAAESERARADAVAGMLDDRESEGPPAPYDHLRGVEGTASRLGAFVGAALVEKKRAEQITGFFVGEADPGTAGTFREFGAEFEDRTDSGVALIGDVAGADDDWQRALDAATAAVEAAYEEYVEGLEAMGVDPKPVC